MDLPQDILARAQSVAAARQTTLQALVVEGLKTIIDTAPPGADVVQAALSRLRAGLHLGGGKPLSREEAHGR